MYGYIYKTTDLSNGIYIGQHKSDKFDYFYFGSGIKISNAIKKYGKNQFKCEILMECNNKSDLDFYERKFINDLNSIDADIGYNIALGGSGAQLVHQTEETKKKISKSNSGKKRTDECRTNFSKQRIGGKWINNGKEQKHVLKEELDHYLSNGWVFGMCKKRKSHAVSEETRKKISESNKKPKKAEAVNNQKKHINQRNIIGIPMETLNCTYLNFLKYQKDLNLDEYKLLMILERNVAKDTIKHKYKQYKLVKTP